ncbi:MAG: MarR family winged helix-turn-helix transcriptional regulator [Sciscionella sp.]
MTTSTERDPLLLSEQACFALYSASRAVTDAYRPILAELGLTYPQYLVMLVLWERDGCSIRQIGEALRLDYGTVSPLLKRLELHNLLTRTRLATDERSVVVTLTETGRRLREEVSDIPPTIGCAMGIDDRARRELIRTLRALTAAVTAATHGRPTGDSMTGSRGIDEDALSWP